MTSMVTFSTIIHLFKRCCENESRWLCCLTEFIFFFKTQSIFTSVYKNFSYIGENLNGVKELHKRGQVVLIQ